MRVTIIREALGPGTCASCGDTCEARVRLYVESGEHRGHSEARCPACQASEETSSLTLDPPIEDKGPHPPSRRLRKRVQKQERQLAESIGGKTQKASGALASHKGDVRKRGELRGEAKATTKKSFTLTREILDKIRSECVGTERPFVHLKFLNPHTLAGEDDWIIIPLEDWAHNQCR